jgi:putative membrane protein
MSQDPSTASNQEIQVELARVRTALAMDRSLLSWIRTAVSLIAFGFTLAKFLYTLVERGHLREFHYGSARTIGLSMMVLGILSLIGGAIEQWLFARRLKTAPTWSFSMILALVLATLSMFLMVGLMTETSNGM